MSRHDPAARTVAPAGLYGGTPPPHGEASMAPMIGFRKHRPHSTRVFPQPASRRGEKNIFSLFYCLHGLVDWRGLSVRPDR